MANNILTSLESISSSLKTINDIKLSNHFYDNIYCGNHYDKYEVIKDSEDYQLYVIKSVNSQIQNFISSVKEVSKMHNSPFTTCKYYPEELISYNDNSAPRHYDVILIKKASGSNLKSFFTFIPAEFSNKEMFEVSKRLTKTILAFVDSKLHIDGASYKNIWIDDFKTELIITERTTVTLGAYKTAEELTESNNKMVLPLLMVWLLTLHTGTKEVHSDAFIEQLISPQVALEHVDSYIKHAEDLEKRYNIPFTNITNHLFKKECLSDCLSTLRLLVEVQYAEIENIVDFKEIQNIIDSSKYDCNFPSSENRAIIQDRETKKFGFTDNFGLKVTEVKYSMVTPFQEGISVVVLFDLYYAMNKYGEYISTIGYDSLEWVSDHNCFIACKNGAFILLNRATEVISKNRYNWIGEFSFGLAVAESSDSGKKGYIDINGNEITPIIYDEALSFHNGIGKVCFEDKWFNVSTDGDVIDSMEQGV